MTRTALALVLTLLPVSSHAALLRTSLAGHVPAPRHAVSRMRGRGEPHARARRAGPRPHVHPHRRADCVRQRRHIGIRRADRRSERGTRATEWRKIVAHGASRGSSVFTRD